MILQTKAKIASLGSLRFIWNKSNKFIYLYFLLQQDKRGKMKIAALSSGSSGNCFYVKNKEKGILVDVGISCKQVIERLSLLRQNPSKIKGIFISHEHTDHIKGVDVIARKFNIPIFATKGTINNCFLCSDENLINKIKSNEILKLCGMEIEAFPKSHEAEEPVSFAIRNQKTLSIITDIGYACKNVIEKVNDSDFLIIESNHDLDMLEYGPYPYFLKKFIKGKLGHLSNLHSALCVLEHSKSKLKNVVLSHLSKINNTPELAFSTFNSLIKERSDLKPKIFISSRENPTLLFNV